MTGRRVLAFVLLIVVATVVVPPAAAWGVNRHRLTRAWRDVNALGGRLRSDPAALARPGAGALVVCGPGRLPAAETDETRPWIAVGRANPSLVPGEVTADPWGNCYLVNVGARVRQSSAAIWVLSAGPNGLIETPFAAALEMPRGDDVGIRIK